MANAGIFAQYIKPVRSMQDYANDYDVAEQNKLALAAKRMEMQAAERMSMEDRDFAELTRTSGGDLNALYRAAMGKGLYGRAQGVQKTIDERSAADLNRRKTEAELEQQRRKAADDYYAVYETARSRFLGDPNISKQKVVTSLQQLAAIGRLPADLVEKLTANLSDDPNELRADIESGDVSKLSPEKRLELFAPKTEWKDDGQRLIPIQTNPRAPGYVAPTPIQKMQTPDSVASTASAAAQRAQQQRQYDETKRFEREKFGYQKQKDAEKPAPGASAGTGKTGPMSVTLQKELLEADDTVQSAGNVVRTLQNALKINDKAYSGYLAKPRAVLRSNLPGASENADATIDIDNMMTGQALESLKVVFGGMPTEGERKILLEMQASADKTPEQRKSIMDRAIKAAERRAKYAGEKAKAIRGGTYLTDGIPPLQDDAPPNPAGKTVKRTGTQNGRKVVEYSDGSIEYAD